MTDEEMAEKWVDKEISLGTSMYNPQIEYYSKQAFLAGLKVGRTQWHKVADGDLPATVGKRYLVSNKYCSMIGYWNGRTFVSADEDTTEIASPIAWCEIPTFDKE